MVKQCKHGFLVGLLCVLGWSTSGFDSWRPNLLSSSESGKLRSDCGLWEADSPESSSDSDSELARDEATEQILDTLVLDFPFGDGGSFGNILKELSKKSTLKFFLHESATDCDLIPECEIVFMAESIRLRTGLDMLLQTYSCTFTIRDGLVWIVSEDAACDPEMFRRKLFDVERLLQLIIRNHQITDREQQVPVFHPAVGGPAVGASGQGTFSGGGMSGGVFALPAREATGQSARDSDEAEQPEGMNAANGPEFGDTREQRVTPHLATMSVTVPARHTAGEVLVELIQSQVCAEDWLETGGDGVVQVVGGVLIVHQSEVALAQVGELLQQLESKLEAIASRDR